MPNSVMYENNTRECVWGKYKRIGRHAFLKSDLRVPRVRLVETNLDIH